MTCVLHERIDEYRATEDDLRVRLKIVRAERRLLESALELLSAPPPSVAHGPEMDYSEYESHEATDPAIGHFVTKDMPKPQAYMVVAKNLAILQDMVVHVSDVSKKVKALDISNAKLSSISASVQKELAKSEFWESIGPGMFELRE